MRRDGRLEPLTMLAEVIAGTALGVAAGCALFIRHRHHSTWGRTFTPDVHARYTPRPAEHPTPWRPR